MCSDLKAQRCDVMGFGRDRCDIKIYNIPKVSVKIFFLINIFEI